MTRKLHNSVTALVATSGLLVLSLMAANPATLTTSTVVAPVVAPVVVQPVAPASAKLAKLAAEGRHAAAAAQRIEARAAELEARIAKAKDGNQAIGEVFGFVAEAATLATIAAAMDGAENGELVASENEDDAQHSKPVHKRAGRQSVAMPFFSFAPRG